jgi:hypothetical protein
MYVIELVPEFQELDIPMQGILIKAVKQMERIKE